MSLFKNSSIYLSSNIINALVPFLLLPILTHQLLPEEYGQIAMFQTLISGLSALTGLNTIGAANRFFYDAKNDKEVAYYNGACVQLLLLSFLILCLTAFIFHSYLSLWLNIPTSWIFLAIAISSGNFLIQLRLGQWQIREKAFKYGILQVSQSILLFIFTLFLLLWIRQGAVSRINALTIGTFLYFLASIFSLYKDRLLNFFDFRLDYIKDSLKFGVPLIPHIIGIFFLSAIDRILINNRLGVAEAGIYMVGVQLSLGMVVFFDALNKALIPWLYRLLTVNNKSQINRLVKITYFYFFVVLILGVVSFWIGPVVVEWVAGAEYQKATTIIGWLCLGQAFNGMYLMVTNYLFYAKKTGKLALVTISCGIFNIILLVVLMSYMGIVGVAMAFAFSMLIRFLATWWLAAKVSEISWRLSFKT
ncbi:lipopolysaccharide biosynthesis protein [Mixta calida]|uniref:lipopolysaccharide biosynthesis protein n=1 Tax=Mixta calida TaxID=665913 RepID=UPI002FDE41E4